MWVYDQDYKNWKIQEGEISFLNFDYLKQELKSTRFYSKCLSGSSYIALNDFNDIYNVLSNYKQRNWYISPDPTTGSIYSVTSIPSKYATPVDINSKYDYYTKYLSEYGLTLKNLFTDKRLIDDCLKNYNYVDVATTESIDISDNDFKKIDNVKLLNNHRILVKNQKTNVVLLSTEDPNDYFESNYEIVENLGATIEYSYYNSENGIYLYRDGSLIKQTDLDIYDSCIRYSVFVKMGDVNKNKQFHLSRLLNGYYPTTLLSQPIEFTEKNNWMLKNQIDYKNLLEVNFNSVLKHGTQSYVYESHTYSIPERIIAIGEFGTILNTQTYFNTSTMLSEKISNFIDNKYKISLNKITQTEKYYWVCGSENIILKIRKHDFNIEKINIKESYVNLNSISFFGNRNGVVVGDLNTIYHTSDGGHSWEKIEILDFNDFNYNCVLFKDNFTFFVAGDNGVFIEFKKEINGWLANKRRISKIEDSLDEYVLVEDINDILITEINTWNVVYNYYTDPIATEKQLIFITTDNNNIIAYDMNNSFSKLKSDFIYFDFQSDYKDIRNIIRKEETNYFYFTGVDPLTGNDSLFSFDINIFSTIGTASELSNVALGTNADFECYEYINELYDYNAQDILICGNSALLETSTYSNPLVFEDVDNNFGNNLKSKLLFLDYDISGKLNFFTNDGEYRLPNSITFSNVILNDLYFENIEHPANAFNSTTYSETNWITYYLDSQKTFEYYNDFSTDESKKVLISLTFSYYNKAIFGETSIEYTNSEVTSNINHIINLAPKITDKTASRFDSFGLTPISTPPVSANAYSIFLYDYLMVYRVPTNYKVDTGDVFYLDSDVVKTHLIVNKILTISGKKYIYMFTEFNESIINDLTKTLNLIKLINLNKFTEKSELKDRFNKHIINYAYDINYIDSYGEITENETNVFQISSKFNNLTAYYNLQSNVIINGADYEMLYTNTFMSFGYSPLYNLMDYLTNINIDGDPNPKFFDEKEYLSLPVYEGMPLGSLTNSTIYFDYNGMVYALDNYGQPIVSNAVSQVNKILMGEDFELEWESIQLNTFVDVIINGLINTYTTERLLVIDKYYDNENNAYVLEFHKRLNYTVGEDLLQPGCTIDIKSRRKLKQISDDLQELNNIQRGKFKRNSFKDQGVYSYETYYKELSFKIPTDSYAKALLSDVDTIQNISGIVYIDNKNELSLNITKLSKEYEIPILNTSNFSGKLYITCSKEHGLKTGQGVVLSFNGGVGSSQELNPQYFGYHVVSKINETDILLDLDYGSIPYSGIDSGYIHYVEKDSLLNYSPVGLIDLGTDRKGKTCIKVDEDNLELNASVYSLINVDLSKLVFKLIDGLTLDIILESFNWILDAEISNALIGINNRSELVWYKGDWLCGRWFGGIWHSGNWISGDWYSGQWYSNKIADNKISASVDNKSSSNKESFWFNGRWFSGVWNGGTWYNGRWYNGEWLKGIWNNGIWNDGSWYDGMFRGGVWITGNWKNGIFNCDIEPAYWLNGKWSGGDFENGIWYNGYWEQENSKLSRFGVKAYNSRTANWHSGVWAGGSFHSRLLENSEGSVIVSDVHKYSIWKTGKWIKGDWYGGIAYNIDLKNGTWYGGILEDIQIIGVDTIENTFTLNGLFNFNINDKINIIDNYSDTIYSVYGSNDNPGYYTVVSCVEDKLSNQTVVKVNETLSGPSVATFDTELRLVSGFKNLNWKSGIWTNGIFENGLFEGGIWYNGIFKGTWS